MKGMAVPASAAEAARRLPAPAAEREEGDANTLEPTIMSNGRLEEQERFAELDTKDSLMSLLIAAE